MSFTEETQIVSRLLNQRYAVNTYGWELKQKGNFVPFVMAGVKSGRTEEELEKHCHERNPKIEYSEMYF